MSEIEEAVAQVERLYQAVTGRPPPTNESPYAPIPAEKDPARQVEEELDRLLRMLNQPGVPVQVRPQWSPPLTVWESATELVLCLDLPGVKRDEVAVALQGSTLVVTGNRGTLGPNGHRLRTMEAPAGRFQRVLTLPPGVRSSGLSAQMRDGVLEIRVQVEEKGQGRSENIPVA